MDVTWSITLLGLFFACFGCGGITCSGDDAVLLVLSTEFKHWIVLQWQVSAADIWLLEHITGFEDVDVDDEITVNFESPTNADRSSEVITDAATTCDNDWLYWSAVVVELVVPATGEQDGITCKYSLVKTFSWWPKTINMVNTEQTLTTLSSCVSIFLKH